VGIEINVGPWQQGTLYLGSPYTSDKCSLAASQIENQKTNHLNGGYGYGGSSCTTPGKPACSITSLKCLYTNAQSMGNKWEELEICVWSVSMTGMLS